MTALEAAAEAMADRHIALGRFRPDACRHARRARVERPIISASPPTIQNCSEIASGPLMRRYSKALEYEYSRRPSPRADRARPSRAARPRDRKRACHASLGSRKVAAAGAGAVTRGGVNVPSSEDPDRRRGRRMPEDRGRRAVRRRPDHQPAQHDQAERAAARRAAPIRRARSCCSRRSGGARSSANSPSRR